MCSTGNLELLRSIGADSVIDYTKDDFTRGPGATTPSSTSPISRPAHWRTAGVVLTRKGTLVPSSNTRNRWIGGFSRVLRARLMAPFVSQHIRAPEMSQNQADLVALAELIESRKVTPVIDRTYPLGEVPEAIRHFQRGHTRGKIVITV